MGDPVVFDHNLVIGPIRVPKPKKALTDPPSVAAPRCPEDRQYLQMMYEEHAEEARQHETLRAMATSLLIALIAGILAFAANAGDFQDQKVWISGAAICLLSLLGVILNEKHYERNKLHTDVMLGLRSALEGNLSAGTSAITQNYRTWHEEEWPRLSKGIRLHILWNVVYGITAVIGVLMVHQKVQKILQGSWPVSQIK